MTVFSDLVDISHSATGPHLVDQLERARGRLEERFLEGGSVLMTALDAIGEMIACLDQVTAALGQDTVDATVTDLNATARQLLSLSGAHAGRQEAMRGLSTTGHMLQGHVDDMLETLRYLRTFAVTVKITGAGAPEFAGFADEMLEKIQAGREEVDAFAEKLADLTGQVRAAGTFGDDLQRQYDQVVPGVARDLEIDAARMNDYHAEVRRVAGTLAQLVRDVQAKVGRVLSALQIGDMTRQRVEHVQAGLELVAGSAQMEGRGVLLRLLAAQMEDIVDAFNEGCGSVTSSLASLAGDTKQVLALGKQARGSGEGGNFLAALEHSVAAARKLVGQVETATRRTEEVSTASARVAGELVDAVDSIRAVRSEIQYMTINTSLRCSRMGEAGKPMNVVASELRVFAEQMETVSGRILERLEAIGSTARELGTDGNDATTGLGESLDGARANIRGAGLRMDDDLRTLSIKGEQVARDVAQGVARLDFANELGEILEACAMALAAEASAAMGADADGFGDEAASVAQTLYGKYTMARERDIHRQYVAEQASVPANEHVQASVAGDDLAAVLF